MTKKSNPGNYIIVASLFWKNIAHWSNLGSFFFGRTFFPSSVNPGIVEPFLDSCSWCHPSKGPHTFFTDVHSLPTPVNYILQWWPSMCLSKRTNLLVAAWLTSSCLEVTSDLRGRQMAVSDMCETGSGSKEILSDTLWISLSLATEDDDVKLTPSCNPSK